MVALRRLGIGVKCRAIRWTAGWLGSPSRWKTNEFALPTIIATDVFENPPHRSRHVHKCFYFEKWSDRASGSMQSKGSEGCQNERAWIYPGPRQVRLGWVDYSTTPCWLAPSLPIGDLNRTYSMGDGWILCGRITPPPLGDLLPFY